MTNSEKYLKNPDAYHDLAYEIAIHMSNSIKKGIVQNIDDFFKKQVKPTLSEDEKVILRNINKDIYTIIGFDIDGLYLRSDNPNTCKEYSFYDMFNSLFQFIYDGEEYKISDLLEE